MNIMIRELEDKRLKSASRDEKYNSWNQKFKYVRLRTY